MNAAGWARESTFRKFYDKPADSESQNFGEQLLLHCNEKQQTNVSSCWNHLAVHCHTALKSHMTSSDYLDQ